MKYKYLCLLAIVVALGASCKKEINAPIETGKTKKADIRWDLPGTGTPPTTMPTYEDPLDESNWGYPNNPTTFPHNTGACTCGMFASCHPKTYSVSWYDAQDWGHFQIFLVKPGQVKFPEGATFSPE